jgi:acetolactate synthase-1/2/3 large subunit
MGARHGGQLLVDQLMIHGVKMAFTVPGESFLAVLDGFHDVRDRAKLVICRHEAGAANMAEAYGKLTNQPGICMVTRGPGATQAAVGVHTAFQDSTPMILLVGDVGSDFRDREAFQEVNFEAMFGPLAKWAARIDDAERIPEYIARAFQVATSGRRGPVVLALPEDMLSRGTRAADARPYRATDVHPAQGDLDRLRGMLEGARRPFMVLGGTGWTREATADICRFAEDNDLPTGCAFRYQDLFNNNHGHYAGDVGIGINPKLAARVKEADVLLVIGARLGEMTTSGYTLLEAPVPKQQLVHVLADANEVGRVYQPTLGIASSPAAFAHALAAMRPVANPPWRGEAKKAHDDYLAWSGRREIPGRVQLWDVVDYLNREEPDAIYCNGAGNFATWLHRFHRYTSFRTQLAPTSGAMGYGVPAAITASLVHPDRRAICFAGDGDFLMSGNELATAVQYGARPVIVILNNGMYGTIRMHQEKNYPGRVSGTELHNPDFAAYARAFGCHGEKVEDSKDFPAAWQRVVASGRAGVIELTVDPEAITPSTTLSKLRSEALAKG